LRSDYTPSSDSDYAKRLRKWQGDFEKWSTQLREDEWRWEAHCAEVAGSISEKETLMRRPLPKVARWIRANARTVE